jgi:hypothetical protein
MEEVIFEMAPAIPPPMFAGTKPSWKTLVLTVIAGSNAHAAAATQASY